MLAHMKMYLFSWIILGVLRVAWSRSVPGHDSSPLAPFAEMLSNTNGKSPLVAATYYFNPGPQQQSLLRADISASEQRDDQADSFGLSTDGVCQAPDGRKGSCYEANECVKRGGMPMGTCSSQSSVSNKQSSGSVCCIFEITCGDIVSERYVYFRNPGYPQPYQSQRMCRARVAKKDKSICQYRMDLLSFDLAPPNQGNCSQDIFVVSGQNENHIVPKICGLNTGHHYYFGVDESGVVSLHMMMLGSYRRKFDILVSQIPCQAETKAPSHCLQYHTGTHGVIKSFNYDQQNAVNSTREGYPNDIDYIICMRKEAGFCSITYELSTTSAGVLPFAVGAPSKSGRQAPIVAQCKDDYLVIGGLRLCSASLQSPDHLHTDGTFHKAPSTDFQISSLLNATFNFPALMTDVTPGPFLVRFVSNQVNSARGFNLNYRQNPCK